MTSPTGASEHPGHHPPHNMVLFGEQTIYASHIVYRQPHNFQVILELKLEDAVKERYLAERRLYPDAKFILFLDPLHIGDIQTAPLISGPIQRENAEGQRIEITRANVTRADFKVIFFNELPFIP